MLPDVGLVVAELKLYNARFADGGVNKMDLHDLADLAVKISSLKVFLGEHLAVLERDADLSEAHYELVREKAYKTTRESGKTGADSDNAKRIEAHEAKLAWIERKYQFKVVSNLWRDTANLIDTLRSRLSYKKSEQQDARNH